MDEMIEILERNFSPVEVVKILNDFRFNQQELDDYAIEHRICLKCYNELVIHSCYEPSEHFGFPVMEEMGKLRCEECGWIEN